MFGFGRQSDKTIVRRYIACLNARNLAGIEELLHADCRFIDSHGEWIEGRQAIVAATERFFAIEPAFRLQIDTLIEHDEEILLKGKALATQEEFRKDALWRARVEDRLIILWQSFGPQGSPRLARILRGDVSDPGEVA
jgi:hypothetical protein